MSPDIEREVQPLPYSGGLPSGSPIRACTVHQRPLLENPISDELRCREGRHLVDSWSVAIGRHILAECDCFGLVAVAPCLSVDLSDYLRRDELDAAGRRLRREGAA